ncbi:TrbC/VirB2 family protein [Comamonas testosteroni]|jgi:type IV secretory pathway VirB2 component (pilin)|uniref:TrbC/VirB2 family protein n=1 Tax=Comamonas testosteroni TaxID=285 RepID=UPI0026F29A52|nr:TrbC/VirB2 family protein [Comamonas testosteroni]
MTKTVAAPVPAPQKKFNAQSLRKFAPTLVVGTLALLTSEMAMADELGDGICKLVELLTGKWLFGIAVLAMLAGGAALIFGAELTDGVKKMVTIITIVGMIVSFGNVLVMVFPSVSGC